MHYDLVKLMIETEKYSMQVVVGALILYLVHHKILRIVDAGHRSPYLSHAKRALYHLSYIPVLILTLGAQPNGGNIDDQKILYYLETTLLILFSIFNIAFVWYANSWKRIWSHNVNS